MMKKCLKIFLFSSIILVFALWSEAADTIKIHLTYKHKLNDAGQTTGHITIRQKFHTPDDKLFREINYDETTLQISDYVFYFYKSGKLFTEEHYSGRDSLLYILSHEYDQTGYETQLVKLVRGSNGLTMAEKTVTFYDNRHLVLQIKKYAGKSLGSIIQYEYDPAGKLIKETRTYKPVAKALSKKESRAYSYGDNAMISQVTVTGKDMAGITYKFTEKYSYTSQGWLSSVEYGGNNPEKISKKTYKYLPSGSVSLYEEYNSSGKIVLLLQFDYKKHYMETGTQVSYYENL